ncbi:MAG: response regulator [Planctomycetota bacterium]|nr:MAG: response regulator [Planctomycetota bacterium]
MNKSVFLLPGEAHFAKEPTVISTLLGSCIALVIHDAKRKWGGMNHYMLPESDQGGGGLAPGKYGDKAIANLLKVALMAGCRIEDLRGRLYGGARVVGHLASVGSMDIGNRNIEIADRLCRDHSLRITERQVGGTTGRKLFFDVATGEVRVNLINQSEQNQAAAQRQERLQGRLPRVLIVDDSSTVRRLLRNGIELSKSLEICGEAENPYEARELVLELDPDVLCLDIIMPRMDGLTFLRKIMQYKPIPTVVVSTIAKEGSAMRRKVMEAGAVDVVDKEELNLYRDSEAVQRSLVPKLLRAARTAVQVRQAESASGA